MSDADELRRADDRQIGMLIQSVATLTAEVQQLRTEVADLKERAATGKGMFYGALFAAGGLGAGIGQLADRLFN